MLTRCKNTKECSCSIFYVTFDYTCLRCFVSACRLVPYYGEKRFSNLIRREKKFTSAEKEIDCDGSHERDKAGNLRIKHLNKKRTSTKSGKNSQVIHDGTDSTR